MFNLKIQIIKTTISVDTRKTKGKHFFTTGTVVSKVLKSFKKCIKNYDTSPKG